MSFTINGIQQIDFGVKDVQQAFQWYRQHLGMDILIIEDEAEATLMQQYTGGKAEQRKAVLAMNM